VTTTPPTKRGRGRPRKADPAVTRTVRLSESDLKRLLTMTSTKSITEAVRKLIR